VERVDNGLRAVPPQAPAHSRLTPKIGFVFSKRFLARCPLSHAGPMAWIPGVALARTHFDLSKSPPGPPPRGKGPEPASARPSSLKEMVPPPPRPVGQKIGLPVLRRHPPVQKKNGGEPFDSPPLLYLKPMKPITRWPAACRPALRSSPGDRVPRPRGSAAGGGRRSWL